VIYATVGGFRQHFDRLIKKIDAIAPRFSEEIVIQKGVSSYTPANARSFDFVSFREGETYISSARLVVSHAGAGTILIARKNRVPIVIVPRLHSLGEHLNDHQLELCRIFSEEKREGIYVVQDLERLEETMRAALASGAPVVPDTAGRESMIAAIRGFIEHDKQR
jgi:UDP-N-acetylglucosamine transferase subunit ALG13